MGPRRTEFIGGFQLGYNWQFGHFLIGVEGDFDGTVFGRPNIPLATPLGPPVAWLARWQRRERTRVTTRGRVPANLTASFTGNVNANLDLGLLGGTYTFATPVLGAQVSASLLGVYGSNSSTLAGTLSGQLATPLGTVPFSRFDSIDSSLIAFGDLLPLPSSRNRPS